MNILLTGGAGYIGSHTAVALIERGHKVIVIDNLSNSSEEAVHRVENITKQAIDFYNGDVRDRKILEKIFQSHQIDGVIHFAGLKAVGESVEKPLLYYENNIDSTLTLLDIMAKFGVKKLVFSSSATVYGDAPAPCSEDSETGHGITNPYGRTKYFIEQILHDVGLIHPDTAITTLRYFNPVGAHPSGTIGEDPNGTPNNLLPVIAQAAIGKRDHIKVFGNDYKTPDGTCIRDYVHVMDLAEGHISALEKNQSGVATYNLGTGKGTSVLEAIKAFSVACGHEIPYRIVSRRHGDLPVSYANVDKANVELGWRATRSFEDACRDAWLWQSQNPNGYKS